MNNPLLVVEDLTMYYLTGEGIVQAVDHVSFELQQGEAVGLVGESGCGKTSLAISLLKILPDNGVIKSGNIYLDGTDLVPLSEEEMNQYRWKRISMIFQAAMNSLNPVHRVGDQIAEAILIHEKVSFKEVEERITSLFHLVGLDPQLIRRYPHEYSGGMRQRAVIAMALACNPDVIIADEPTTALDVIVQDKILAEMRRIQKRLNMSMIYISHDIAVVAEVTDKVGVMYAGKLVEWAATVDIFARPRHPYTKALISTFPSIKGEKRELVSIPGDPPDLVNPPHGCRFHPRCPYATDICKSQEPPLEEHDGRRFACWHPLT